LITRWMLLSTALPSLDPAWKYQASLIGHSLSGGMNLVRLANGGMCSLSPCSADAPRAAR